jgi:nuclear pore complex protein Nup155
VRDVSPHGSPYSCYFSFNLTLNQRVEYLTLAVGNAKSQPAAGAHRLESALQQLTDLEAKLEVAQIQLEVFNILAPRKDEGGEVSLRISLLQKRLMNVTDVSVPPVRWSLDC